MMDAQWAEDHGYKHIRCGTCRWSGMTDGDGPECDCNRRESEPECEDCGKADCQCSKCINCGEKVEARWDACRCDPGPWIESFYRVTQHTARKADPKYGIQPGDLYRRQVQGGYVKGGGRWLTATKRVLRRAIKPS